MKQNHLLKWLKTDHKDMNLWDWIFMISCILTILPAFIIFIKVIGDMICRKKIN